MIYNICHSTYCFGNKLLSLLQNIEFIFSFLVYTTVDQKKSLYYCSYLCTKPPLRRLYPPIELYTIFNKYLKLHVLI